MQEMTTKVPKINYGFTNIYGKHFDNIREIAFKQGELYNNLGNYITESNKANGYFFGSDYNHENGVYIYQHKEIKEIGYRIYKKFADYDFNGHSDDELISKLMKKQQDVETKFPTGVVTLDGRIIGQEIRFYYESVTLNELSELDIYQKNIETEIYLAMIKKLKDQYKSGIIYIDVHPKNFVFFTTPIGYEIKIIDFEKNYMVIDEENNASLNSMVHNLKNTISSLNKKFNIEHIVGEISKVQTLDECEEKIIDMDCKLKKYCRR
ncbi:MAG: hypothetical protein PHN42_06105 [Bacilli bacterium]|nr:hypothetical protein [Bacilli bacterium]